MIIPKKPQSGIINMRSLAPQSPTKNEPVNFTIDEEGFLLNSEDWNELFAEEVLGYSPGQLSSEHLKVIYFVRDKVLHLGGLPPLRLVCKSTGLDKVELKKLFGSCIHLWKAAGLPKPDDELRSYMY